MHIYFYIAVYLL